MERYEVAQKQIQEITKAGEALGYWKRIRGQSGGLGGGSRPWVIRWLATADMQPQPTTPLQEPQSERGAGEATTNPQEPILVLSGVV